MIGMKNNNTEDKIVLLLLQKRMKVNDLKELLDKQEISLSLPSLYDQLNKLVEKEVVVKTGIFYSVNNEWVQYVQDIFTPKNEYILKPGEKVKYQIKKLSRAESYWKHIVHSLYTSYEYDPVFIYNPHSFWSYIPERKESEDSYFEYHEKNRRYGYYILGGTSIFDINYRKQYSSEYFKIDIQNIESFKRTEHITVIDDLIFTMTIPKSLAKKIDTLYSTSTSEDELIREIHELEDSLWTIYAKIENNTKKAKELKKKIARMFMSQKEITKKFK